MQPLSGFSVSVEGNFFSVVELWHPKTGPFIQFKSWLQILSLAVASNQIQSRPASWKSFSLCRTDWLRIWAQKAAVCKCSINNNNVVVSRSLISFIFYFTFIKVVIFRFHLVRWRGGGRTWVYIWPWSLLSQPSPRANPAGVSPRGLNILEAGLN